MFDHQLKEIDEKIPEIIQARFWSLKRFLRPYAGFSIGNIILYLLTAGSAFTLGPATIRAIIQKIKHR